MPRGLFIALMRCPGNGRGERGKKSVHEMARHRPIQRRSASTGAAAAAAFGVRFAAPCISACSLCFAPAGVNTELKISHKGSFQAYLLRDRTGIA